MPNKNKSNVMWGGRFSTGQNQIMQAINSSISFDKKLFEQDIKGSIIHAKMLSKVGIISREIAQEIVSGLEQINNEIMAGDFEFSEELEDIHMNIENRLTSIIGSSAGWLHTARSRNDQVATDLRLWVREEIDEIAKALASLQKAFLVQAESHYKVVMPGFTHLQIAQPVTFGHHMLAYVEMFSRDTKRFINARSLMNESPLGSAALAGTSFKIDRNFTAEQLGFDRPMLNSLDAVSARDFTLEFVSTCAICATHLSRFAEELVLWSSAQFEFVEISESFSSGSSIMPQKKNPDAAELIRAKAGRINGALVALLTIMKGLPLAYSKDLQEDKEQVFDCSENLKKSIYSLTGIITEFSPNVDRLAAAASLGHSTATDIADYLVQNLGIPFRKAHEIVGKIVKVADKKGISLQELDLKTLQQIDEGLDAKIYAFFDVENSVNSRKSFGGTSPQCVLEQINYWKDILKC